MQKPLLKKHLTAFARIGTLVILASVIFTGCQDSASGLFSRKPDPSPTVIPSPPLTIGYTQTGMGFSLQLPASWEGHYREEIPLQDPSTGEFDTVYIEYVPQTGQPAMIFSVNRVDVTAWQQLHQDPGFLATELGQHDGQIYYAQTSATNPYPGADAQRYQQFSLDVPRILETFSFNR